MLVQRKSSVYDVVETVKRFRILCVGRAGVGKSSVINRVFGVKEADVADWKVGEADIEREFTSTENQFFVLHDSKGFEPGNDKTFDTVREFILQRADKNRSHEDRLHAVWLCTQAPKAGGRIFEIGDEKLLQLAHRTQTPVVVVFTKYDQLIRSKKAELRGGDKGVNSEELDKRSKVASQKVLDVCVESLKSAIGRMDTEMQTKTQMPPWVKISIYPGYNADIAFLVDATGDLVREKLEGDAADAAWLMWTIAQRASLPLKIEACVGAGMVYFRNTLAGRFEQTTLRQLLAIIHKDIVTCWNFGDKENILSNEAFDKLIFLLVQDVEESRNQDSSRAIDKISQVLSVITDADPHSTPDPTFITLADALEKSLLDTASSTNQAQAQRLFMTYVVVLTTILKSLFNITLTRPPRPSGRMAWSELKEAFETYKGSGSRQQIHRGIYAIFQQDKQVLDLKSFRSTFSELVEEERPLLARNVTEARSTHDARGLAPSSPPPPSTPAPTASTSTTQAPTAPAPTVSPRTASLTTTPPTVPPTAAPTPTISLPTAQPPSAPPQARPRRGRLLRFFLCRPSPHP